MIDLTKISTKPGVYIYRDSRDNIIYVGKAVNLKKRISQYFQRDNALGPKTTQLVSRVTSIETKIVNSEIEALILESSLIKQYHPKYNSLLKDDKSYLYITISRHSFPIISTARSTQLSPESENFGPFPDSRAVKSLLKTIRRIFPFYSKKHSSRPCLYCHLHLCPGPNPDKKKYRQTVNKIKKILTGKFMYLQRRLKKEMNVFSQNQNYESALIARQQLESINYIVSGWRNLNALFDQVNLPEDRSNQAINELSSVLKINPINRIECFDISQLGSRYFVGSMVVWQDGHIDKNQYKKFKIKSKFTPDDQFMIKEIVYRRLKHPEWGTPDLIIVDGGKPQVSAVSPLFSPIIGLAKKFETIVLKDKNIYSQINLPQNSSALNLLQFLRDEAHRFANYYRRQLIGTIIR